MAWMEGKVTVLPAFEPELPLPELPLPELPLPEEPDEPELLPPDPEPEAGTEAEGDWMTVPLVVQPVIARQSRNGGTDCCASARRKREKARDATIGRPLDSKVTFGYQRVGLRFLGLNSLSGGLRSLVGGRKGHARANCILTVWKFGRQGRKEI